MAITIQCPHYYSYGGTTYGCMLGKFPVNCETCNCPDKQLVDITTTNNTKDLKWRYV